MVEKLQALILMDIITGYLFGNGAQKILLQEARYYKNDFMSVIIHASSKFFYGFAALFPHLCLSNTL